MPLLTQTEALIRKLESFKKEGLQSLCAGRGVPASGSVPDLIKRLVHQGLTHPEVDLFIKEQYEALLHQRERLISTDELRQELSQVQQFDWGVIQGGLDAKIQREFVRRYARYDDLVKAVTNRLWPEVTSYVICTWFNHWTTVLIEEAVAQHPKVVPTLKPVAGIDFFFQDQPFDLKVTYLPKEFDFSRALQAPKDLIIWFYENQGPERFGAHNRLFAVLYDYREPSESWKLKREFGLINREVEAFFDTETVSLADEVVFEFAKRTYTAIAKILFIIK